MAELPVKMLVLDLDGTLLNDQKIISDRSKKALAKLHENGVVIVFASGRTNFMMSLYKEPYVVCDYHLSFNGGMIEELRTGEILYQVSIKPEIAKQVWQYLSIKSDIYTCYTKDTMFFSDISRKTILNRTQNYIDLANNEKIEMNPYIIELGKEEMPKNFPNNILKFVAYEKDQNWVASFKDFVEDLPNLRADSTGYGLTGVFNKSVSKEAAIRVLCKRLNIPTVAVAAFGDYENDLNMFNVAGIKVAMENATESLKKQADYICPDNNSDGVARFIEENLL